MSAIATNVTPKSLFEFKSIKTKLIVIIIVMLIVVGTVLTGIAALWQQMH